MLSPLCVRVLALAALAPALASQTDRFRELFDTQFERLADPARARDAARTLTSLGERALPLLRERLDTFHRGEQPFESLLGAMVVLARMGKPALEALPELLDVMEVDGEALRNQAVWTLTRLAPHVDAAGLASIGEVVDQGYRRRHFVRNDTAELLAWQMHFAARLAAEPENAWNEVEHVVDRTYPGWYSLLEPALLHVAAVPPSDPILRRTLREHCDQLLTLVLRRPSMPDELPLSDRHLLVKLVPLAEARRTLAGGLLDTSTARGLLGHWDADVRLSAVSFLAENGASLPPRERADLASVLWDADADVASAAARAFAGFGRSGLVGLAPLARRAAEEAAPAVTAACRDAATSIVDSFAGHEAEGTVRAFFDVLCGAATSAQVDARSPQLAEALHGLLWADARTAIGTIDALATVGMPARVAASFALRASCMPDVSLAKAALLWLAHHPADFARAEPMGRGHLAQLVLYHVPRGAHPAAAEALAWIGSPRVPTRAHVEADLATSTNPRRIVRTLVTAIADAPESLAGAERTLNGLAAIADDWLEPLDFQQRELPWTIQASLFEEIRLLSVVASAAAGLPLPELTEQDAQRVREHCGVEPKDLAEWVRGKRDANALKPWLAEVEERAQRKIGVNPEGWPAKW